MTIYEDNTEESDENIEKANWIYIRIVNEEILWNYCVKFYSIKYSNLFNSVLVWIQLLKYDIIW